MTISASFINLTALRRFLSCIRISTREARGAGSTLLSFALSLMIGVGSMVCARGLGEVLEHGIAHESKKLLGADIMLRAREPVPEEAIESIRSKVQEFTSEIRLRTMARTNSGNSHIVQLSAIEGAFPLYGEFESSPVEGWKVLKTAESRILLVHSALADKLNLSPGDALTIGSHPATIGAIITKMPGDTSLGYAFAPRVFVEARHLPKEDLLSRGALADYFFYLKLRADQDATQLLGELAPLLTLHRIESETVAERKQVLGEVSSTITSYFSLIGTIALLLGTLNAVLSLQLYLRQKRSIVAVLKCVGAKELHIFSIFGVQIVIIATIVSCLGAALGGVTVAFLPALIERFSPFTLTPHLPLNEMVIGVLIGVVPLALLLIPSLRELSLLRPVEVLRPSELAHSPPHASRGVYLLGAFLIIALTIVGSGEIIKGALMGLGVVVAYLVVALFASLMQRGIRSLRISGLPLALRYAIAHIDRPGNQSLLLLVCFGIGTTLLSLAIISRHLLQAQTELARSERRTNAYLFDVQIDQVEPIRTQLAEKGFEISQAVPVVLMRLVRVGDRSVEELLNDPDTTIPKWTLNREYWSTYRAHQTPGEQLTSGVWIPRITSVEATVPVSIEDRLADRLGLTLGDTMEFDISGIPLVAKITSIRDILWERLERNSFLVFPEGVFENYPRFYVLSLTTSSSQATSELAKIVASVAPNVSVLDVRSVVDTIEEILEHIGFVVKLLAGIILVLAVCMLTGILIAGRGERDQEGRLLRVLGAPSIFMKRIVWYEYSLLAAAGAVLGVGLGSLGSLPLSLYVFKTRFSLPLGDLLLIPLGTTIIVLLLLMVTSSSWRPISISLPRRVGA